MRFSLFGDDAALLQPGDHTLEGVVEVSLRDLRAVIAARADRGLVIARIIREIAPVRPAVWRAIASMSMSSGTGFPRMCTARMSRRPFKSGA